MVSLLPNELFVEVFNFLSRPNLCQLETTSRNFFVLIQCAATRPLILFSSLRIGLQFVQIDIEIRCAAGKEFTKTKSQRLSLANAIPFLTQKFVRSESTDLDFECQPAGKKEANFVDPQMELMMPQNGINVEQLLFSLMHIWAGNRVEFRIDPSSSWQPENAEIFSQIFNGSFSFNCFISTNSVAKKFSLHLLCADYLLITSPRKFDPKLLIKWMEESPVVGNREPHAYFAYLLKELEEEADRIYWSEIAAADGGQNAIAACFNQKSLEIHVGSSLIGYVKEFLEIWKTMFLAAQIPAKNPASLSISFDPWALSGHKLKREGIPTNKKWTNEKTNEQLEISRSGNWLYVKRETEGRK